MDTSKIYSTTGKGLVELKTGAVNLSPFQLKVLELIDGKSSVSGLAAKLKDAGEVQQLPQALEALAKLELIHVFDEATSEEIGDSSVPEIEVLELSPTESVQAWAEAQRGTRELEEKGFYSPPASRHASHEAGANVNRILIVEDDATTAEVLNFLLTENNFQVIAAADGEAAWAELQKRPLPDVVLLDVMLPGRDGFEVLGQIRHTPHLQSLPVIMVTSQIRDEYVMRGLKEGADGYVFKPFKWETLHACIKNVL
ncbi:MAG: response regulator transcription factor [Burkholderiales bacterium]|nr:response regulator transcription factor [Burkholderiales bacterium]